MHLALFDFDGTLTHRDSMFGYLRHVCGGPRLALGMVLCGPVLVGMVLKLVPRARAKEILLRHLLGGRTREALAERGASFVAELDADLRPEAVARLEWHLQQGHRVLLVSASLDLWLAPWAEARGLTLLCTGARFEDGRFVGLGTPNCRGPEKVARIRAELDPDQAERIYAYGDSGGDREMLALAHEPYLETFPQSS